MVERHVSLERHVGLERHVSLPCRFTGEDFNEMARKLPTLLVAWLDIPSDRPKGLPGGNVN